MADRRAVGFHQDEHHDWVVELECGHTQHVRHKPPLVFREWVTSEPGRRAKLGKLFDCSYCDMPELPPSARVYKQTTIFDTSTVPSGLLGEHRTKAGTWGRIVVAEGMLSYQVSEPEPRSWLLRPGVYGIIAPGQAHSVRPHGQTRFYVEFLRCPDDR